MPTEDFDPAHYISCTSIKGCMAFLDVIIETKKKMLNQYYPEDKFPSLTQRITGINAFRAIAHGCEYCEAFMAFSVDEFMKIPLI